MVTPLPARRISARRSGSNEPGPSGALHMLSRWIIAAIVITGLYLGKGVLIPIALAVFLSFLLAPVVGGLRRLLLPRGLAVILAIVLALGAITLTGTVLVSQAATLIEDAPAYAERIADKAGAVRDGLKARFGLFFAESLDRGGRHAKATGAREARSTIVKAASDDAIPVELREPAPTALEELVAVATPVARPIETLLIVLILTVFILIQRFDLRDRLIRLLGATDIHRTSIALDDGAQRLSRYFLSQLAVNTAFGAIIWGGLFLIGIPAPGLWGILAGLLRFVPYVGSLIAVIGPLALAAAIDPGWTMLAGVAALFIIVEPLIGYALEPLLYGRSSGLSPVSVVVAAIFWTWLWGPIGLILSMPLTLILVALGRHIPAFAMFDLLLGDRPALSAPEIFYQRILLGHIEEAMDQAEELLQTMPLIDYHEQVVLEGLELALADADRGLIDRAGLVTMCKATLDIVAQLDSHQDVAQPVGDLAPMASPSTGTGRRKRRARRRVLCVPARGPLDPAVAAIVAQLLDQCSCDVELHDSLTAGGEAVVSKQAEVLCLVGLLRGRSRGRLDRLGKRLAQRATGLKIVVGIDAGGEEVSAGRLVRLRDAIIE